MKKAFLIISFLFLVVILVGCNKKNKLNIYKVEFETFNGSYIESQLVEEGLFASRPNTNPTKKNHEFVDWYKDKALTTKWIFNEDIVMDNTTIYAKFDEVSEIEEFLLVSFFNEENLIEEKMILKGEKISKPNDLVKDGYIFLGWFFNDKLFDFESDILVDTILKAKFREIESYTITLVLNGGELINTEIIVNEGEFIELEIPIHPDGLEFVGWFDIDNKKFESSTINKDITLYAKYLNTNPSDITFEYGSYPEAIWILIDNSYISVNVKYKLSNKNEYIVLDQELIRSNNLQTEIDIVGLTQGYYDLVILLNDENEIIINQIFVDSHDRSGYAHFNYSEGIGAYKDDGTLKDDALVVYVTEENKDSIKITGINQVGLGFILNNNQFSSSNTIEYNNSLAKFNRPIVFRIIGKVTVPLGATKYNSTENGGSIGDNGNMVRIKDANHITIEGIGQNAEIHGWGIHFMASTKGRGIGFEVRNITFDKYAEDAIGMEGVQSGSTLTAPVERGWIHNSTFKQGYHANPAEKDKKFGDGSLDIKRGQYFTISYNEFLNAYKTNLFGGTDDALQYHITYHHNYWQNAQSRTPLARNGNIHMYNNVFLTTDDNIGEVSYAVNTRVNAYILTEANYFYGIKNPFRISASGGPIKSYNDILYSTHGEHHQTTVSNRDEKIASNNKFANFDTNPEVFYYDEVNKRSDVKHLTDAFTAKVEVMNISGTYRKNITLSEKEHYITNIEPEVITESVIKTGGKILKSIPFYVFEINVDAKFTMTEGTAKNKPKLVNIYGMEMLTGSGEVNLAPGIYILESDVTRGSSSGSPQAKESFVESFSIELDSLEASIKRIEAFNNAVNNIPERLEYNDETIELIRVANHLYDKLLENEKELVDSKVLTDLTNELYNLGKNHIETLINNIGTVTEKSYPLIKAAQDAYQNAIDEIKMLVVNLRILTDAVVSYQQFEVSNINETINLLKNYDEIDQTNKVEVNNLLLEHLDIKNRYEGLSNTDQAKITNYIFVINNIKELEKVLNTHKLKEDLVVITNLTDNLNEFKYIYDTYQTLDEFNKVIFSSDDLIKLDSLYEEYLEIVSQRTERIFYFENHDSNYFRLENATSFDKKPAVVHNEYTINKGLKLESKTIFTIKTNANARLILVFETGESVKINDQSNLIDNNEVTIDVSAGDNIIKRDSKEARLLYVIVIENY